MEFEAALQIELSYVEALDALAAMPALGDDAGPLLLRKSHRLNDARKGSSSSHVNLSAYYNRKWSPKSPRIREQGARTRSQTDALFCMERSTREAPKDAVDAVN
jgi:hypothetical protein